MKKVVLALLLTMPHVAWGSEARNLEDSDSHSRSTVNIFKRADGKRDILYRIGDTIDDRAWSYNTTDELKRDFDLQNRDFYVGVDRKHVCIGSLLMQDNKADVLAALFDTCSGNMIDTTNFDVSKAPESSTDGDSADLKVGDESRDEEKQIAPLRHVLLQYFNEKFLKKDTEGFVVLRDNRLISNICAQRSLVVVAHKLACKYYGQEYEEADLVELTKRLAIESDEE